MVAASDSFSLTIMKAKVGEEALNGKHFIADFSDFISNPRYFRFSFYLGDRCAWLFYDTFDTYQPVDESFQQIKHGLRDSGDIFNTLASERKECCPNSERRGQELQNYLLVHVITIEALHPLK